MQIYLSSQLEQDVFLQLLQDSLAKQALEDEFEIKTMDSVPQRNHRGAEELLTDPAMVTLLASALSAGGIGTVFISKLARVFEALIKNRNVQIKVEHDGKHIEMSGSAGHIAKMLKEIVKSE